MIKAPALTPLTAAALYLTATLAMTWPLMLDLGGSLPGDLGDPLLNCYILSWGEKHLVAFLAGDLTAYARWWQANIYYPAPYALAYSEHLFAEVAMALPVWLATGNVILCYNVVFLASYAMSGLGTFLLVRELTGQPRAALVAGLCFAFVPYRISQTPHLQVLSSEWMPFTLYAMRRYFAGGRPRALVGALAALVAQQLACGYYLIYFTPFVAFHAAWEITARGRWRDWRLLASLAVFGAADVLIVWPFLAPYLMLRRLGFAPRSVEDLLRYSADLWSYLTAADHNRVWGPWLALLKKSEGDTFPGGVLLAAAIAGVALYAVQQWRSSAGITRPSSRVRQYAGLLAAFVLAVSGVALLAAIWTAGFTIALGQITLSVHDLLRLAAIAVVALVILLAVSRRARAFLTISTDLRPWALVVVVTAVALSLGPQPRTGGRILSQAGPYLFLFEHVPGFDGLRVPARLAMVAFAGMSVLAGYAMASLDRRRMGRVWMAVLALVVLVETTAVPFDTNINPPLEGFAEPPRRVLPAGEAPRVYRVLKNLPANTVVAELPFGVTAWELRAVYYASVHDHPVLNGYSGGFPGGYFRTLALLSRPLRRPDQAWDCLVRNRVTHVIIHQTAFINGEVPQLDDWLASHGAHIIGTFGADALFELPH